MGGLEALTRLSFWKVLGGFRTFLHKLEMAEDVDGEFLLDPVLGRIQDGGVLGVRDTGVIDEDGGRGAVEDSGACGFDLGLGSEVAFVVGEVGNLNSQYYVQNFSLCDRKGSPTSFELSREIRSVQHNQLCLWCLLREHLDHRQAEACASSRDQDDFSRAAFVKVPRSALRSGEAMVQSALG